MKKIISIIVDIILVVLAEFLAFYLRLGPNFFIKIIRVFYFNLPFIIIIRIWALFSFNLYEDKFKSYLSISDSILKATALSSIIITAITYFNRNIGYPRSVIIFSFVFTAILMFIKYYFYWKLEIIKKGKKRVLIIGEIDKLLQESFILKKWEVVGVIEGKRNKIKYPYLGKLGDLQKIVKNKKINLVIISLPYEQIEKRIRAISECEKAGIEYLIIPSFYEIVTGKAKLDEIDDIAILEPEEFDLGFLSKIIKRLFDIAFSLIFLILFLPFFIIISILIKIDSPGPVIYKQLRAGQYGKPFYVYKFRTMVADADKIGPLLTEKNDKRVTRIGRFLRRFSIDEIPQFYNILKGDMSIVGPRPEVVEIVRTYNEWQKEVLKVKPGITGLSQISGRQELDMETKLKIDLLYIKNYSLFLDLKIIFKTIFVVLKGKGAY